MTTSFRSKQGLIVIPAELFGVSGSTILRMALDKGATYTTASVEMLAAIGYQPDLVKNRIQIITGSGLISAPRVIIQQVDALSQTRLSFPVLAYTLPKSAGVDGLLGLDFLRHRTVTFDFRTGRIIFI
ncbi:MAG: retroviral-like aspartic protease family protein [Oculatellaceae cyanobacterium Prado106]|jgi:predicted aspartyl protease|nr:retroviral-like aspartic protease family protein [Oculatellaceae cyanobacterium Prado106]